MIGKQYNQWQIACRSSKLKRKPLGVTLSGSPVVLFRDSHGVAHALEDRCAHRNAPLSAGTVCARGLQCAYHGWTYDGSGRVAWLPALNSPQNNLNVAAFECCEQDGFVWVASLPNQQPALAPVAFPNNGQAGWTTFTMHNRFEADVESCLENFLDCPHATFVHRHWFRSPTNTPVNVTVTHQSDGVCAEFFEEPRTGSAVWSLLSPKNGTMQHTDRFIAPARSQVNYRFANQWEYVISSSCTEVTDEQTDVYTVISFRAPGFGPLVRLYFEPLSWLIIKQDVDMLARRQRNLKRFLAPQSISTRADLIGPHIVRWRNAVRDGVVPSSPDQSRELRLHL